MALKPARLQWSEDGSFESADYGDVYFQRADGIAESRYVFLQRNRLEERFGTARDFRIAELGFGSGLNFLLTCELWKKTAPEGARLFFMSVEKHPIEKKDLARIYAAWPELKDFSDKVLEQYPPAAAGFHHIHLPGVHLMLAFGDVAEVLPETGGAFDAWYLDGFAQVKNPEMWADGLFPLIAARTAPGGTLATFSAVGAVRRGLAAAGFAVQKVKGFGIKWAMTVATFPGEKEPPPRARRATVLGAGLAGCSAAHALAEKGYRVTVIDRQGGCARETSGNPAGVLYPKLTVDVSPLGLYHLHGFCYTRALLEHLKVPSWSPCGVLRLDMGAEETARTRALVEKNEWPADLARAVADGAVTGIAAGGPGLFHETAGHVSPPDVCRALLDHPNIETVYSRDVTALPEGPVVIALGNESGRFDETAWLPLQSLRGQVSYLAATAESAALKTVVCHKGFVTPAVQGTHYAGATFQKEPYGVPELRAADHAENVAALEKNLPALKAGAVTGGRAGYRATTPDKLPLVGPCPDHDAFLRREEKFIDGVYVTAGFGAHGLAGAPLAGEIIACLIAGDPPPVPASLLPYLRPERFILRDLKRGRI